MAWLIALRALLPRFFKAAPLIVAGVLLAAVVVQHRTIVVEREVNREFRQIATDATGAPQLLDVAAARAAFTKVAGERAALQVTVANVRTATAKAQAADLAHARAVEAAQDHVTKERTDALTHQLADARAAADAYARRLRPNAASSADPAHPGGGGTAGLPPSPGTAGRIAGTGQAPELDDARACAENTVKAQGWIDWWTGVKAVQR